MVFLSIQKRHVCFGKATRAWKQPNADFQLSREPRPLPHFCFNSGFNFITSKGIKYMQLIPKVPQPKSLLAATSWESGCCSVERACKKTSDFIWLYWVRIKYNLVIIFLPWQQKAQEFIASTGPKTYYFAATEAGVCCFNGPDLCASCVFFPFFFCICCVFPNRMICVKGSAVRLKIIVITKRKTGKM